MNSGAASSSVTACAPLAARATAVRVALLKLAPSSCGASFLCVAAAAEARTEGVGPFDVRLQKRGGPRPSQRSCPASRPGSQAASSSVPVPQTARAHPCPSPPAAPKAAIGGDDVVVGRSCTWPGLSPRLARIADERAVELGRSPSLAVKAAARCLTAAGGGSSVMKWRASLVAMNEAVAGWRARSFQRTATPLAEAAVGVTRVQQHLGSGIGHPGA